ncbi:hypothetical protein F0U61_52635 [Archangium violaceum]|uniref:hypothetical protein n=1 Tax=Archangium violaceum TaxID=83451 RepID=UPI002B2F7C96|nr:hypothetical protein F0U61_52635 [Archangium violaceum]
MFSIPRSMLEGFEQVAFQRYQQGLIFHIREYLPGHATYLSEQQLLRVIQRGCELAEGHGFKTERDLCLYTDLTLMLGSGFDSDPQLEWVPEILKEPVLVDPRSRMDALWDQAMDYMDHILGPGGVFPKRAYRKDRSQKDRWRRMVGIGRLTATDEEALLSYFDDIWPEKARYVGGTALRTLIREGRKTAEGYGIRNGVGQAEFLIHAFLFGHQFHADPQYPWAHDVLGDEKVSYDQEKIVRMVKAFDEHLNEALS